MVSVKSTLATVGLVALLAGCGGRNAPTPPRVQPEDKLPSWSPDGQSIAYVHFNPDVGDNVEPSGLYVIDAAGSTKRLVIRGFPRNPDWSPDGRLIAFNDDAGLHVIGALGEGLHTINPGGSYPSWSPDGTEIAFSANSRIWTIRPDGTGLRAVTPPGVASVDPDWSPDGRRMVFLGNRGGTFGEDVFILHVDSMSEERLTIDNNEDRSPAWSPCGDAIVWNPWLRSTGGRVRFELWVMDTIGTSRRHLVDAEAAPAWDPSGSRIAFSDQASTGIRLFVINIDGTGLRQLTN